MRLELGSFGYYHEQVSSGLVEGPADYYVSYTRLDDEGYAIIPRCSRTALWETFGYQITPDLSTRFNLRYAQQNQNDAGYLTWSQFQSNPHQSQYGNRIVSRINPGSWLGSNVTTLQIDPDSSLAEGIQYNNYPINNPGTTSTARFLFDDISSYLRYKRSDTIFGDQSNTELSFIGYHQLNAEFDTWNTAGIANSRRPADLSDWTLVGSNDTELVHNFWVTTGVAGIYQTRETTVAYSTGALPSGSSISREYFNVDPRIGLRYELTPNDQIYANLSRSVDTPSPNSYVRTDAVFTPVSFIDLKPASATTAEVGTRGQEGIFKWDADYYYSWINDELLTTPVAPGSIPTITNNASPTFHQGVEVGLDTTLWQDAGVEDNSARKSSDDPKDVKEIASTAGTSSPSQQLVFRQVYTWSDFHYVDDPLFGHNSLPAVPVNLYEAEFEYDHSSGFYANVNVKTSLTKYAVDYANTLYTPAYALLGARIGYDDPKKHWGVYVEGDNLNNKNYASAVSPTFNANGNGDSGAYFAPGVGRAIYAGASYRF